MEGIQKPDYLLGFNYAGLLLLSGEVEKTRTYLKRLETMMDEEHADEPFPRYLLNCLKALCHFSQGERQSAIQSWEGLQELVERIPYTSKPLYVERHEALLKALNTLPKCDISAFDNYFQNQHESVRKHLGNSRSYGVLITPIYYWRHS